MIRRVLAPVAILIAGGLVVAMLQAEEAGEQSVLSNRESGTTATIGDRVGSGLADTGLVDTAEGPSGTRPRLVDRLQQLRRSVVDDVRQSVESQSDRAGTILGPVVVNSAKQNSSLTDRPNEPKLLPSQTRVAEQLASPSVLKRRPRSYTTITDGQSARRPRSERQPGDLSLPTSPQLIERSAIEPNGAPFAAQPSTPSAEPTLEGNAAPIIESPAPAADQPSLQTAPPIAEPLQVRASPQMTPRAAREPAGLAEHTANLLTTEGAALRVDTVGPDAILIGREAEYTLTLTNQSTMAANDVLVRVIIPVWVDVAMADATLGTTQVRGGELGGQHLVWNAHQLSAGGLEQLKLKVVPRENRPFHLAVDWTQRPATSVAEIMVQQPQLEMAVFGPREIHYGETAVYTIQLANPGTGPAEGVAVEFGYGNEQLPTKEIGDLAAGEQTEIRVELTANQAGVLHVAASAVAAGGLRTESNEDVLVRRAKLETEVVGVAEKFAGHVATYEVCVRNVGDAAASNVSTNVSIPQGAKYLPQDQEIKVNGGVLTRPLGTIAPGSERAFRIACQLLTAGDNLIEARTSGRGNLLAMDTFVTKVKALADLKLEVNDPKGPIALGADTVYELIIHNRGTKAAHDVHVVAQFSEGIEPIEATGGVARTVPGQVLFNPITRIEPGEQVKLKIVANADRAGTHRFRAEVKSTEPDTVLVAEESTYFFGDDLTTSRSKAEEERR